MSTEVLAARAEEFAGSRCFLLEISGEVRNLIYEYASEDNDEDNPLILRHCVPALPGRQQTSRSYGRTAPIECRNCIEFNERCPITLRSYYGLTQVCRQIRTEFLPIYRAHTQVHVYKYEIYQYIDTLIALSGEDVSKVIGNVVLYDTSCGEPYGPALNLRPLMDIEHVAPRLALTCWLTECTQESIFVSRQQKAEDLIIPLLNSSEYPLLRRYVEEHVSNITLHFDDGSPIITFTLLANAQLPPWFIDAHSAETEREFAKWEISLGLTMLSDNQDWLIFTMGQDDVKNDYWSYRRSLCVRNDVTERFFASKFLASSPEDTDSSADVHDSSADSPDSSSLSD